jgi:hypothetical protein
MKTKTTLSALALGAMGLAIFRLQACAVVGYVNLSFNPGYHLIQNPLDGTPDNNNTTVISSPPPGTMLFLWDVPSQSFGPVATYDPDLGGWDVVVSLPPGRGFFLYVPSPYTNTFVGEVEQGTLTNFVAGNNRLSALGSKAPQSGTLSGDLGFPMIDGANVFLFSSASQTYTDAFTCFNGFGWFDPNSVMGTNGPVIAVAQAFFVQNPGPDTNWIRTFSIVLAPLRAPGGADISSLRISGGTVTLKLTNPGGGSYTIQFSSDGVSWSTVASGLTGTVWQGPYLGGERGYYQVIQP